MYPKMVKPNATIQHIGNNFYHVIIDGRVLVVRSDDYEALKQDVEKDHAYYKNKTKQIGKKVRND